MSRLQTFLATYGKEPHWIRRGLNDSHFQGDLQDALFGSHADFRRIVFWTPNKDDVPHMLKDLWKFGVKAKPHREYISKRMQVSPHFIFDTFGDEADTFLRDAGFGPGRLKGIITLWRGGAGNAETVSAGRCWTLSYSMACGFALQSVLWQRADYEQDARSMGIPEPMVVSRNVERADMSAFIGGPEREVILTKLALAIPARQFEDIREWRRHRSRKTGLFW